MSRYPFIDCIKEYVPRVYGHVADETMKADVRHLKAIGRVFTAMKEEGVASTDNPRRITAEDVDAFVGRRKAAGISASTILKDLGLMKRLFEFYDNGAVGEFRAKYPSHVPRRRTRRASSMEDELVERIVARALEVPVLDWKMSEAYMVVSLALCSGLRPKELRMLYLDNVSVKGGRAEVYAVHVKGEGSYGSPRWVPVHPRCIPVIERYLEARAIKLASVGRDSEAFFPPIRGESEFVSYGMVEKLKQAVEADMGEKFTLYKCRRTYGQSAVDEGQDFHNVSLAMGHSCIATTQRYYCDKDQHRAAREMSYHWAGSSFSEQKCASEARKP